MLERAELVAKGTAHPASEVLEKPVRRRFTVEYKVRVLAEADACTETGQLGELLRREGLYSSHLSTWRRQRDKAPATVYAALLDEGTYHCSIRTMYRILHDAREIRERRNQLRHPKYKKPELLATGPNQVWSWDITKLLGPAKWTYYYLYVILDIYSRYAVGWMLASCESADLAKRLIRDTIEKEDVDAAYADHPERFVHKPPSPLALPEAVWINPPPASSENHEKGLPKTNGSQKPDAPSAHPRSGYRWPGCVPAEPDSVSPDHLMISESTSTQQPPSDTRVMPQKTPGAWGCHATPSLSANSDIEFVRAARLGFRCGVGLV